jgi:hypothetical protein
MFLLHKTPLHKALYLGKLDLRFAFSSCWSLASSCGFYSPFGAKGLKSFSVPLLFLVVVGALYNTDNVYPYGKFTPLQFLVPGTTTLAAIVLNLMGYKLY